MNFRFFDRCSDFVDYYFNNEMDSNFELIEQQFEKDRCYVSDDWISWCVVELDNNVEPLAVIGVRKESPFPNTMHISSFEVNLKYRDLGFGKLTLETYIKKYCDMPQVSLYAEEKNRGFYEKLGFEYQGQNLYIKDF